MIQLRGLLWLIFLLSVVSADAQSNLIQNHSFEISTFKGWIRGWPDGSSQLNGGCADWKNVGGTTTDWFRFGSNNHMSAIGGGMRSCLI
jgi:hypothetical protein